MFSICFLTIFMFFSTFFHIWSIFILAYSGILFVNYVNSIIFVSISNDQIFSQLQITFSCFSVFLAILDWMPDLMNFVLFSVGFCYISLESVELSFVTQLFAINSILLRFTFMLYESGFRAAFSIGLVSLTTKVTPCSILFLISSVIVRSLHSLW